jgi:pilus assembly protein CpaF
MALTLFQRKPPAVPASKPAPAASPRPEPVPVRAEAATRAEPAPRAERAYYELKERIHSQLIERLDLSKLDLLPADALHQQIRRIVEEMLAGEDTPLSRQEREQLISEVEHETFGLGPIEPLMQDPRVSDILVNGPREVYVERRGKLERTRVVFRDNAHLLQVIERIVSAVGRRVDESSPMVDARLADGSRVNAIIPPLALDGPVLSIRRFAADPLRIADLIEYGTLPPTLAEVLRAAVQARLNILVSGGTGAGKTTLLNVLSNFIPNSERIVTIEDSAELQLQQEHVVRLETRPANIEGAGAVTQRDLVRNALRMRPDRIVVGEVRGGEALDMLQAMNTGHDGSISTIHANSSRDALSRIETMMLMSGISLPVRAMRDYVASALDMIVQVARLSDGTRKVVRLTEVVGMEEEVITSQDIFVYEQEGVDADGRVLGHHRATGVRPKFSERLLRSGIELGMDVFDPGHRQAVR